MSLPIRPRGVLVGLLFLPLLHPYHAQAQVVTGIVLDAISGEAVAAVELVLLTSADKVARVGITGSDGGFTIEAEHTGRYRIHTNRIGYEGVTSDPFDLLVGDTVQVELRIGVAAVGLAPLRVVSIRDQLVLDERLERYGFYGRKDLYGTRYGFAEFFDYDQIRDRRALAVSDLLRLSRRIRIIPTGGREVDIRGPQNCRPAYLLNGILLRTRGESINDLVAVPEIIALEVYMGRVGPWGHCVIAIWTGYHDGMSDRAR